MSPAQAGAFEFEEPNWKEEFESACGRWPRLPRYLQEDNAFEDILKRWRRFHATPLVVVSAEGKEEKKMPAAAIDGIIALAKLKIMPPRFVVVDFQRDGETGFQHDDHCWLSLAGEQWRIKGIEDRMLMLERMDGRQRQIDLNKARWAKYTEAAVAVLEAMKS